MYTAPQDDIIFWCSRSAAEAKPLTLELYKHSAMHDLLSDDHATLIGCLILCTLLLAC